MGPRTRTLALVLGALALAPAAAGCGGGGTAKTDTAATLAPPVTPPPTATTRSTPAASGEGKVDLPKPYRDVAADVQKRLNALAGKVPAASDFGTAGFTAAAQGLAGDVGGLAAELRRAQAPVPVRTRHAAVLGQLTAMQDDFRALVAANESGDLKAASDALGGVSTALARVQSDIRRIRATVR
jgi:hypothetical protein